MPYLDPSLTTQDNRATAQGVFKGNTAPRGGALAAGPGPGGNQAEPLLAVECTFIADTAGQSGGVAFVAPGGALSLIKCRLEGTRAPGGGGLGCGGVAEAGRVARLNVSDSEVVNCSAGGTGGGGGLLVDQACHAHVARSRFDGNHAVGDGGAVRVLAVTAAVLLVSDSNMTHNVADGSGGGVSSAGCNVTLDHVILQANTARGGGGGLHQAAVPPESAEACPDVSLRGSCHFVANRAQRGGAVFDSGRLPLPGQGSDTTYAGNGILDGVPGYGPQNATEPESFLLLVAATTPESVARGAFLPAGVVKVLYYDQLGQTCIRNAATLESWSRWSAVALAADGSLDSGVRVAVDGGLAWNSTTGVGILVGDSDPRPRFYVAVAPRRVQFKVILTVSTVQAQSAQVWQVEVGLFPLLPLPEMSLWGTDDDCVNLCCA